ncbi:MAG TPA: hypothetical protein VG474_12430 [Solirubrobacteraceae bacterium]|nr:hypothetical protein [Solirubrobacteraceae bacterium]
MTTGRLICVLALALALAAASLVVVAEPVYDAWAWLVWGRELAQLQLDATTGPAWKPLPVAVAALLSLAGDAAPQLWLVLVRAAWLVSLVLAAELAHRLSAGRPAALRLAAGAFAVGSLVLLADEVTHWGRQVAGGMSEPLLVALVLGAVRAGIARRTRSALALGTLAALVRPEGWPLLVVYGLWCWRGEPRARPLVVVTALGVPALWLVPNLLLFDGGGAQRAQTGTSDPLEALAWAAALPLAVAWPLALVALRDRAARVLGAGALGWIAIVAAMTTAGFAGLPRFMTPAAAVAGVLGGAGLAALLARPRVPRAALALVLAAAVVTAAGLPGRVGDAAQGWSRAAQIGDSHARLRALVRTLGRERLLACGRLATSDTLVRTALAWELDAALSQVVSFGERPRLSGAFVVGERAPRALQDSVRAVGTLAARADEWRVYSIDCPATASPSPVRSAGVSGATR